MLHLRITKLPSQNNRTILHLNRRGQDNKTTTGQKRLPKMLGLENKDGPKSEMQKPHANTKRSLHGTETDTRRRSQKKQTKHSQRRTKNKNTKSRNPVQHHQTTNNKIHREK